ncbi:MAG TPA: HAMP domain-containing protein, partial [Phototrophicaceae bacterium]|nr:HAMP domain-containing protein [Phototrophicaceae bacterium]
MRIKLRKPVFHLTRIRIRTRLLIINVGILFVGFAALTLVAGQQISSAARADFEQRLQNEIQLIAHGIAPYVQADTVDADQAALDEIMASYEQQLGGKLTLLSLEDGGPGRTSYRDMPEVETALRGEVVVVSRPDADGQDALCTASSVNTRPVNYNPAYDPGMGNNGAWNGSQSSTPPDTESPHQEPPPMVIVQLTIPAEQLQALVWQRWASLLLVFSLVAVLALAAAIVLSRSIIRPLYALRESAVQLAKGDFSHRVAYDHPDEIGEVAQAFNEMAHQVQSMLEEQRAFASNTSHELRTPLTTIRLRSEALRYDTGMDQDISRRYIDEIDDEVNRMG